MDGHFYNNVKSSSDSGNSKAEMVGKFDSFAEAKDWSFCNSLEDAKNKAVGAA